MKLLASPHKAPRNAAKVSLSLLIAVIASLFAASGCNDYGNTFQSPTGVQTAFIAPSQANAGGAAFTLTVSGTEDSNGNGFVTQSVVQWNGKTIPTTYVSANVLTATVSATLIAKPGTAYIQTLSPHSGSGTNGLSNTVTFLVNPAANPIPTISSMSPTSAAAGAASFTLTITGTNFIAMSDPTGGSQVRFNLGPTQSTLTVLSVSSTQITATVPSSVLVNSTASPVTGIVTVYNPPAAGTTANNGGVQSPNSGGGGTSLNGLTFTVNPAGSGSMVAPRAEAAEETPAVSADGRYVSYAATQGDHSQVFVRDTCEGAESGCVSHTTLLSAASDGTVGNADSRSPSMSSDGRYIAFSSAATNLAIATSSATSSSSTSSSGRQIYLHDTCAGAQSQCSPSTQLVSTDPTGQLVGTEGILPSVSASGRFIAFLAVTPSHASSQSGSTAAAKSAAATTSSSTANSGFRQVFIRDTCLGASSCTPKTTRISLQPGDTSSSEAKPAGPALSGSSARVAVPGAATATVFTHSVAVDDRIFLALTGSHP
jgi:WD40-like Beta Propeller Repeat